MKIPLIGSLGINSETGIFLAAAGLAAFVLMHNMGTKDAPPPSPPKPKGPADLYGNDDDFLPQRIGWTVPLSTEAKSDIYGGDTRSLRKGWPLQEDVERAGFEIPHPNYKGRYPEGVTFVNDPKRKVSNPGYNSYVGRAFEGEVVETTSTTTPTTTDPKIVELQDRILKTIVRRTNNVTTILSNLETIKAEIQTYTGKLQLALQQVTAGLLNQAQLAQYLESIVTEITTKLKISIAPGYGDNTVPDYYQQYYQDYQKYVNQLNSNYYDYYQPSYQYFPGQTYDYYQPYQYQYPSPYYPNGQYPTNYPYYGQQQQQYYPQQQYYGGGGQGATYGGGSNITLTGQVPPNSHFGGGSNIELRYPPGIGTTFEGGSNVTINGRNLSNVKRYGPNGWEFYS